MKYAYSSITDRGLERDQNEDNCAIATIAPNEDNTVPSLQWQQGTVSQSEYQPLTAPGALAIVADGMGGRNAGEVASQMLINSFEQQCNIDQLQAASSDAAKASQYLSQTIAQAHNSMLEHLETHLENLGMATTVVSAWLTPNQLHLAWCGDCRAYQFTLQHGLQQLTHDHSYVQQLVDEGKIKPEEAFDHPEGNLVTRGIGDVDVDTDAETCSVPLLPNSLLLLCSDGICGYLRDALISDILSHHFTSPADCTQALLQAAYDAGGGDNITATVISIIPDNCSAPQISFWAKIKRFFGN